MLRSRTGREDAENVFQRVERDGVAFYTVPRLLESHGILVAFSERLGGVSSTPFSGLNLASHVGDKAEDVDSNRDRLFTALDQQSMRDRLTTAEQVHGTRVAQVTSAEAGAGSHASGGRPPLASVDGLWTKDTGTPLMLLFADCVPVVLVRPSSRAVAVVHAGWRGAASGVVEAAVGQLAGFSSADDVLAFIGPHICATCYNVGQDCVSHFDRSFVTIAATSACLNLQAVVADALERSGVPRDCQWHLGICTAQNTDRFYSHRAEGITGRHGALALIL